MRSRIPSVAFVVATLALVASVAFAVMRFGGFSTFILTGRSMEPAIPVGSVTIVQSVSPGAVQVGDVVTFSHDGGRVVTHRLVAMESDGTFWTKGDANEVADPEQFTFMGRAGVVRAHVPLVGYALAGWRPYAQAGALVTTTLCLVLALLLMRRRSALADALDYTRKGDRARAITLLMAAVRRDPLDRVAHRRLGAALANSGDLPAAAGEYARYVRAVHALDHALAAEELAYANVLFGRPRGLAMRRVA